MLTFCKSGNRDFLSTEEKRQYITSGIVGSLSRRKILLLLLHT